MKRVPIIFLVVMTIGTSCTKSAVWPAPAILGPTVTHPAPLVDSFFYGYAYVDRNENGVLDEADPPLKGVIVIVKDKRGLGSSAMTDANGSAMVWWPSDSKWPVIFEVKPPTGTSYKIIGEPSVIVPENQTKARFLFEPQKTTVP